MGKAKREREARRAADTSSTPAPATTAASVPPMSATAVPAHATAGGVAPAPPGNGEPTEPFYKRHPKAANAIFAAVWVYVAALWLLALDQWFHWGIFGPKLPPTP